MYKSFFCNAFKKNIKKLDPILQSLVLEKIDILKDDPDHPSLRTELLYRGVWASSVNMGIRIIWRLDGDTVRIVNIGKHDIYKQYKNKRRRKSIFRDNQ
jgi:mRNA interferase RelE/StbE